MKPIICFLLIVTPTISFAQNVGIGTSEPTRAKLEVHGAVGATSAIFGADNSGISLQRNLPSIGFNQYYTNGSKYISTGFGANLYLNHYIGIMGLDMLGSGDANGTTQNVFRAFTIAPNGNMSVKSLNTTGSSLYVARTGSTEATAGFAGTEYTSFFNYGANENTYIRAGKNFGTVFLNDIPNGKVVMSGFVGINTVSPTSALEIRQVNGKGLTLVEPATFNNWQINVSQAASGYLNLYLNGSITGVFASDGSYGAVSDSRLKRNIQVLPATMGKLMQLRPVAYEMKYNNPGHERSTGFLAQELKAIFPELVTTHKDTATGYQGITDLHTVNYAGLTPFLLKGMQEQQQVIQSLQSKVDRLEKTLEALMSSSKVPAVN
jgi:hypothetical protein